MIIRVKIIRLVQHAIFQLKKLQEIIFEKLKVIFLPKNTYVYRYVHKYFRLKKDHVKITIGSI